MTFIRGQKSYAIKNDKDSGPIFGGKYKRDLVIGTNATKILTIIPISLFLSTAEGIKAKVSTVTLPYRNKIGTFLPDRRVRSIQSDK